MTIIPHAGGKPLRILVVGTHDHVRQPSMKQFAVWFEDALRPLGSVRRTRAPSVFHRSSGGKWLTYLDQYVLMTLWLAVRHLFFDLVVIADHSNSPSALLVPGRKLVVMVHDTTAIRQAKGEIADASPVRWSGRLLQRLVLAGIRRASLLLTNPGPVDRELTALGVSASRAMVGCPVDPKRLGEAVAPADPPVGRYLLNVGGDNWRKRKADLLRLWRAAPHGMALPMLAFVGFTSAETRLELDRLGLQHRVRMWTNVTDGELAWFYENCEALIVAGHEEGFCIPVAEAIHFGKAVFGPASAPIYPMIFGDAVTLVDLDAPQSGARELAVGLAGMGAENPQAADRVKRMWSLERFDERVREAILTRPLPR
ncbi:MAG: glycosyltransferase [Caulobacteraceae bacterium]|nr:glycosyltransferase [Caulobacteraceae bacterium]